MTPYGVVRDFMFCDMPTSEYDIKVVLYPTISTCVIQTEHYE